MEKNNKILVVDDRKDIAESIRDMLSNYYEVDIETSGFDAFVKCLSDSYYALLIDVDFEYGVSGIETASRIRSENKDIKIIIFSGFSYTDSIRKKVIEIGAQFIEKPLTIEAVKKGLEDNELKK